MKHREGGTDARTDDQKKETLPNLARSPQTGADRVNSRVLAGDLMGVSHGYVGAAKRLKEASPDLFERARAGELALSAAIVLVLVLGVVPRISVLEPKSGGGSIRRSTGWLSLVVSGGSSGRHH